MRIDREDLKAGYTTVYNFNIALDEDYNMVRYDQEGREFFGSNLNSLFSEVGEDESCNEELRYLLDTAKKTGQGRVITYIRDRNESIHLFDLIAKYNKNDDNCYDITGWNIPALENECFTFRNNMWKYKTMLGMSSQSFFDYDMKKDVMSIYRYVGKKSVRLFYGNFAEFIGKLRETAEKDDKNKYMIDALEDQLSKGKSTVDISVKSGMLHNDGKLQKLIFRARFDDMSGHRMMYGIINHLSEGEEDLPYYMTAAGLDSATGLLSKRSIIEYSYHIFTNPATNKRKHYMVLLDIDDFKSINDNYGHLAGDQAIQLLATTLMDVVRDNGMVGRFGGDEFFILTDRISEEEEIRSILRRIKGNAEVLAKETLGMEKFTLSMGISLYPDDGDNYKDLLALADKCLYIAKEKGKNRYIIYRTEMHSEIETGARRKGISSYDDQSKSINRVIKTMFKGDAGVIPETLTDIVKSFDLDSIDVFYKDLEKPMFTCGKYPSGFKATDFTKNKKLMDLFDSNGVYVLHNVANIKHANDELYDMLLEKNCMSFIQVALPSPDDPKYLFSCNMLNRSHKWSDAEISNLGLYGSLIYDLLSRND
ncbi:MAG: GGDEF domain-containing protein [Lachnospiraceae bacterium]|nr:GGDEF domain-containing protein [Lachnospiraceae bacterium]